MTKNLPPLTNGTIVTIYQDPITEQKSEGRATVKYVAWRTYEPIDDQTGLVEVAVTFVGEPDNQFVRRLKVSKPAGPGPCCGGDTPILPGSRYDTR